MHMNSRWKTHIIPRQVAVTFLLLAAGLTVVGALYYDRQEKPLATREGEKLAAIADLKVREIALWRRERMGDALSLFDNPEFAKHASEYFQNPALAHLPQFDVKFEKVWVDFFG